MTEDRKRRWTAKRTVALVATIIVIGGGISAAYFGTATPFQLFILIPGVALGLTFIIYGDVPEVVYRTSDRLRRRVSEWLGSEFLTELLLGDPLVRDEDVKHVSWRVALPIVVGFVTIAAIVIIWFL